MNDQSAVSRVEQPPSLVRVASDELLLLGARLHDDVALGVLYDRYSAEVYAATFDALRQDDAAEAAMHDAFLRIWRGVEIYDASYGTTHDWLIGIARNRAFDALAKLEPFGGVPDRLVKLGDTGLLAPPEPASGARERLLARARAESSGPRAAEAPTVVLPLAEFGPDVEPTRDAEAASDAIASSSEAAPTPTSGLAPVTEVTPVQELSSETEIASADEPTTSAAQLSDDEPTAFAALPSADEPTTSAAQLADDGPATLAGLAQADPSASEAVVASDDLPISTGKPASDGPPTLEAELTTDGHSPLESDVIPEDRPTLEAEIAPTDRPPLESALTPGDPLTPESALTSEDPPALEPALTPEDRATSEVELASEAPTLTGLPILGPPTPNGQYAIVPDVAAAQKVSAPDAVAPPPAETADEPITQEVVLPEEATTREAAVVTDAPDQHEAVRAAAAPPERKPTELAPSEALAVALAPIQPKRPQPQRHAAPEAPRKRGIKLASVGWASALLFVVASGLAVATWNATGPHVSPDLNVMSRLPGGRIVVLRGTAAPTASARLHSVDSGRRSELLVEGLPPLPAGRVYQSWLIEPNLPARSAGAFYVNRRGDAVIPVNLGGPVERLQAIAITQEQAPGAPAPTGPRVLEGTP